MTLAPPRAASPRLLIAILILVSGLNPIAVNMFVPAMPDIMRGLAADQASVQLVLSVYLFSTAVAQFVLGPLSDRYGRRPVLIGGLILFVGASIVCTTAQSIGALIAGRILQGGGGCVGIVLGRAIVRDRYERDRAAAMIGYVTMGFAIAPMIGPVLGGVLNDQVGWRSIFGLLTALGLLLAALAFLFLPETRVAQPDAADRPGFLRSLATLSRLPAFWAYALTTAFGTAVFFAFLGGTPFVAIDMLGMTGTEYGLYFILVPGGFMLGNFLTGRFSQRLGILALVVAGSILTLIAVAAMLLAFVAGWYHPLSLFAPMYLIGFANGLTLANALAGAVSVRPDLAGAASGLAGSLQIGAGGVATVVIGALLAATHSVFPLIIAMMVLAAGGVAAALWTGSARS
jgi:DHA1 family bicyclomycin/chloramphenicol resistance-like MFS transporter